MPFNQGAQEALVQWANSFTLDKKAESTEDFHDGILLSRILSDLDTSYDPAEIDTEDDRWLTHKKNLQSVYKGLVRLINRELPGLSREARISDFRAIASDPNTQGICKFLSLLFAVAMLGSNNERFVTRITKDIADPTALGQLQKITIEMKTIMDEAPAAGEMDDARDMATEFRDPDLALEEENAEIHAELDRTKKRLADTSSRLEHLQVSYDELKEDAATRGQELEAFRSAQDGNSEQVIRSLEVKIREQEDLIANQESQAEDDRQTRSRLTQELTAIRSKANKADTYEDELNELRFKVDELGRKANAADRYKTKLEAQANLAKEMENLLYEKEQMQRDLIEYEKLLKRNKALEDTNDQYAKRMGDYEVEFIEMDSQRKAAQTEISQLKELIRSHEERSLADERFINELQEQINTGTMNNRTSTSTPDAQQSSFNLEEELESAKDVAPNLSLEISRLKAENNMLRGSMGSGTENARLRQELDDERAQRKRIQGDLNIAFERQKAAEAECHSLVQDYVHGKEFVEYINHKMPEGGQWKMLTPEYYSNEILANYKAQVEKAASDLKAERGVSRELRERIADRDRELLSARTDLSAVEKDSVDALEELKSTDKLLSESLRDDLDALRAEFKNVTYDLDEGQKALVKALLEKDSLRKELDMVKDSGGGQASTADSAKTSEKMKQFRTRLQERNDQLEKAEREKYDLMRKLKALQNGGAALAQKTESDQIIKNLQRENALITTAWYDLTSRLQSNHVVLQRRSDAPKSWLNKQRQMVNATPRR